MRDLWWKSGTGAGFLRVLRFPLPILIPPTALHSSIVWGWYNRPVNGRRTKWTHNQSHPTPRKLKKKQVSLFNKRTPRPESYPKSEVTYLYNIYVVICGVGLLPLLSFFVCTRVHYDFASTIF
jgi:hypothetical protein